MARIFVSGSATGLGLFAGRDLLAEGNDVILHARTAPRAEDIRREVADACSIVVGDVSTVSGALDLADQVNALGPVDAVIHNAGVGYGGSLRQTADGFPDIFAVNVLAPYILTARISGPKRLVYLSSSMHRVSPNLHDVLWRRRRWNGSLAHLLAAKQVPPVGSSLDAQLLAPAHAPIGSWEPGLVQRVVLRDGQERRGSGPLRVIGSGHEFE